MKITDGELLDAIWKNQLKKMASSILDHYVGVSYGLGKDIKSDWDFVFAVGKCSIYRDSLNVNIGNGQLLIRIKKLLKKGLIKTDRKIEPNSGFHFYIDSKAARDSYEDCYSYWKGCGVPSGFDEVKKCSRSLKLSPEELKEKTEKCIEMLMDKYVGKVVDSGTN